MTEAAGLPLGGLQQADLIIFYISFLICFYLALSYILLFYVIISVNEILQCA